MNAIFAIEYLQKRLESGDIHESEPIFVLRARDEVAQEVVDEWIDKAREAGAPRLKIDPIVKLSHEFGQYPIRQVPGRPDTRRGEDAPQEFRGITRPRYISKPDACGIWQDCDTKEIIKVIGGERVLVYLSFGRTDERTLDDLPAGNWELIDLGVTTKRAGDDR